MSNVDEKIWVKIQKAGYIPQLGIQGPIPNPIQIPRVTAKSLLVSGIPVYEYDPETKKTIELTLANVFSTGKSTQKPVRETNPTPKDPENDQEPVMFNGIPTPPNPTPVSNDADNEKKPEEEKAEDMVDKEPVKETNPTPKDPENDQEPVKDEKKEPENGGDANSVKSEESEKVAENKDAAENNQAPKQGSSTKKKSNKKNSGKNSKPGTTK